MIDLMLHVVKCSLLVSTNVIYSENFTIVTHLLTKLTNLFLINVALNDSGILLS